MTKHQTEQLYQLTHHPLWPVFVAYKQERLDGLRKELDWASEKELKNIQGRIAEVKLDLELADKIEGMLE